MYYVYRFKDGYGDIIYIGRTKTSINSRMSQHFGSNGHLPLECYNSVYEIEYLELKSQTDMYIKELYYISKWKPKFNTINVYEESTDINLIESNSWVKLQNKHEIKLSILQEKLIQKELENKELIKKIKEQNNKAKDIQLLEHHIEKLEDELTRLKKDKPKHKSFKYNEPLKQDKIELRSHEIVTKHQNQLSDTEFNSYEDLYCRLNRDDEDRFREEFCENHQKFENINEALIKFVNDNSIKLRTERYDFSLYRSKQIKVS